MVRASKRHDYRDLAIKLQRIEAGLIVDTVLPALHVRGIWCASIHDSVLVREADVPVAILSQAFADAVGIAPTIESRPLIKEPTPAPNLGGPRRYIYLPAELQRQHEQGFTKALLIEKDNRDGYNHFHALSCTKTLAGPEFFR